MRKMFEPCNIGKLRLKNRIIMTPMGDSMEEVGPTVSAAQIAYYAERAKGGVGLILHSVNANPFAPAGLLFQSEKLVPRLNNFTHTLHSYGAKVGVMLSLGGGRLFPQMNAEGNNFAGVQSPLAPSETPVFAAPMMNSKAYTTEQVYELIAAYGKAANIAKRGGYDVIHIQGYGGYLIDQFMSEIWNKRTDEFGGSFENRMRFAEELVKVVKKNCGNDFPIIWKMTPTHLIEGGRTIEEGLEVAKLLEKWGVDAIHIDVGCYEVWHEVIPPVYHQERVKQFEYAKKIKEVVNIPVFTQGKVGNPEEAIAVFEEGMTDFVALGRSFLADPYWAKKVKEDRVEDIRPCICCNEACVGRLFVNKPISCAVNPMAGHEASISVVPATDIKNVIVVGAGPGGCEAALRLAERGHNVELWEKTTSIGGALIAASNPADKREMKRLIEFYKAQIYKNSNIRLRLNTTATAEKLLESKADAVVLATGGTPIIPDIKGINGKHVHMAMDVLKDKKRLSHKIVVAGGGFVGCETAMHLDYQGKEVVIIEMKDTILSDRGQLNTHMMMMEIIGKSNIQTLTNTKLVAIEDGAVIVERDGNIEKIECDETVLALGFKPNFQLEDELLGKMEVYTIGDAVSARKVLNAVWEAFSVANSI